MLFLKRVILKFITNAQAYCSWRFGLPGVNRGAGRTRVIFMAARIQIFVKHIINRKSQADLLDLVIGTGIQAEIIWQVGCAGA